MYYDWIQQHKRTLIISTIVFFMALVGWSGFTLISRQGKVGVTISAVPRDAAVLIDGKKTSSGTHWLIPGTYTISAEKDGFTKNAKTVVVTPDKEKNVVALSLAAESEAAMRWVEKNEREYLKNQEYGALEARANGVYFRQQNPIASVLPFTDPYYTISYQVQDDNSIMITIATPSPRYRYLAVEKLRTLGYNPTDFRILFTDYKNPLGDSDE